MTDSGRYRAPVGARPIYAPELILVSSLGRWCCQRPRYLRIQRLDSVMGPSAWLREHPTLPRMMNLATAQSPCWRPPGLWMCPRAAIGNCRRREARSRNVTAHGSCAAPDPPLRAASRPPGRAFSSATERAICADRIVDRRPILPSSGCLYRRMLMRRLATIRIARLEAFFRVTTPFSKTLP